VTRLRQVIGAALRRQRQSQARTLREVADAAGVSLTYLSEIERGRKEASSEVLEAICAALDLVLSALLFEVAETLARIEAGPARQAVGFLPAPRVASPPRIAAAPPPAPAPAARPNGQPVPVASVLDFQAFAGRRSA
jgi:transcriptional regulator with XRE-family HTH domain